MSHIYRHLVLIAPDVATLPGVDLVSVATVEAVRQLKRYQPNAIYTRARVTLTAARPLTRYRAGAVLANVRLTLPGRGYKD